MTIPQPRAIHPNVGICTRTHRGQWPRRGSARRAALARAHRVRLNDAGHHAPIHVSLFADALDPPTHSVTQVTAGVTTLLPSVCPAL